MKTEDKNAHTRMAVVVENYNDINWTIVAGENRLVDSLLNKTLNRAKRAWNAEWPRMSVSTRAVIIREVLRALIAAQWALVIAASSFQNWDALLITFWIIVCACTSAFVFRTDDQISS